MISNTLSLLVLTRLPIIIASSIVIGVEESSSGAVKGASILRPSAMKMIYTQADFRTYQLLNISSIEQSQNLCMNEIESLTIK